MKANRSATMATLGAVAASLLLPLAAPLTAAHADPPSWAPAHGWRAKHGGDDEDGRREYRHRGHGRRGGGGGGDYTRSYSNGDQRYQRVYDEARSAGAHRQQTKNTWRNAALGGGAAAAAGVLTHNKNLTIGGAAAALYSAYRYDQDRKNQARGNN